MKTRMAASISFPAEKFFVSFLGGDFREVLENLLFGGDGMISIFNQEVVVAFNKEDSFSWKPKRESFEKFFEKITQRVTQENFESLQFTFSSFGEKLNCLLDWRFTILQNEVEIAFDFDVDGKIAEKLNPNTSLSEYFEMLGSMANEIAQIMDEEENC